VATGVGVEVRIHVAPRLHRLLYHPADSDRIYNCLQDDAALSARVRASIAGLP